MKLFKRIRLIFMLVLITRLSGVLAGEGMWVPVLMEQLDYEELRSQGFKLSPEDIYSVNQACLVDAVLIFGSGCTGGVISDRGLIITNHHCAYDELQSLSTLQNDILTNGYRAMRAEEEIPVPGLSVKFLRRMEDVSDVLLEGIDRDAGHSRGNEVIAARIDSLVKSVQDTSSMMVEVTSFYYGNTWLMFLYEEYRDIRLVSAPPHSLGKFGGDLDNWMWPRHTADYSLFRIYASTEGKPADYSSANLPLRPENHFTVSARGVEEGDFTMVLGFPGRTYKYLTPGHLEVLLEADILPRMELLDQKLDILRLAMDNDEQTRLKYAAKYASASNVRKKYEGVVQGFENYDVLQKKENYLERIEDNLKRRGEAEYLSELVGKIDSLSGKQAESIKARRMFFTGVLGIDAAGLMTSLRRKLMEYEDSTVISRRKALQKLGEEFFRNYDPALDLQVSNYLLGQYLSGLPEVYHPELLHKRWAKGPEKFEKYVNRQMRASSLTREDRFRELIPRLADEGMNALSGDPFEALYQEFVGIYFSEIAPAYGPLERQRDALYSRYVDLLMKTDSLNRFYPDANFTLRLTYGKVEGYQPADAIHYKAQTHVRGILEKNAEGLDDYFLEPDLSLKLESAGNSGYATANGLPAAFIASNHTSGGNSGSPVLNAHGELVGINFDRSWESTVGDYYYIDSIFRNISVDIRFVLFLIDEVFGQGYLLEEMTIKY